MSETARILPLSSKAVSQIQSSKQITSLQGVALGLLENSLDAGATKIDISIDFLRGGCTVEDDGSGIPLADFTEHGGLARMYHTSKHDAATSDRLHGNSGMYLAALAALSLLNITSTHLEDGRQAKLTIYQGKVIRREVSAHPAHQSSLATVHGTCVTVRDLFGNLPVRVKQRSLAAGSGQDHEKAWQEVKRGIIALLLAWHSPCSVRIRDEHTDSRFLHLSALHPGVSAMLTEKALSNLNSAKSKYDLKDALPILSQAGLTTYETRDRWIPISASTPEIVVKGSICLNPAPTKQCQFISIGVRPCDIRYSLYDSVNKLFLNSSFGAVDDASDIGHAEKHQRRHDRRSKSTGYTRKQLRGRKDVDCWPMFVLQITIRAQQYSAADPEKMSDGSLKAVDDVLSTMIAQWLVGNHFRPRKYRRRNEAQDSPARLNPVDGYSSEASNSRLRPPIPNAVTLNGTEQSSAQNATVPRKRKIIDIDKRSYPLQNYERAGNSNGRDYFHSWSRIKSGRSSFYDDLWDGKKPATAPAGQTGTKVARAAWRLSTTLELPTIEAGALSHKHAQANDVSHDKRTQTALSTEVCNQHPAHDVSSEDYGSFSEREMLLAAASPLFDYRNSPPSGQEGIETTDPSAGPETDANQVIHWLDPVSKQTFRIDSRTGVVVPSIASSMRSRYNASGETRHDTRQPIVPQTTFSPVSKGLSLVRRPKSSGSNQKQWLPAFLEEWNNPVFAQQDEPPIPVASFIDLSAQTRESVIEPQSSLPQLGNMVTKKLSKSALRQAKVIKQVDRKYIFCTAGSPTNSENGENTAVLIDQHAASERVILEKLLSKLCTFTQEGRAKSISLEKALRFDVAEMEFEQFKRHRQHFMDWGIDFDLTEDDGTSSASQIQAPQRYRTVVIRKLPPCIAERCMLVPKLAIDLLRTEIWALAENFPAPMAASLPAAENEGDHHTHEWLKRIGSCPKGILDMLNSRACRSAVMFNDELSNAQCEQLVSDLSRCAFPFMCAHGRVSMVPIVDLGMALSTDGARGSGISDGCSAESFTATFRKWREKAGNSGNGNND